MNTEENGANFATLFSSIRTPDFPQAACKDKDPDMWVHNITSNGNELARKICRGDGGAIPSCPHLAECTDWAWSTVGTSGELKGVIAGWYESSHTKIYSIRPCEECGDKFTVSTVGKRFCSQLCRKRSIYKRKYKHKRGPHGR